MEKERLDAKKDNERQRRKPGEVQYWFEEERGKKEKNERNPFRRIMRKQLMSGEEIPLWEIGRIDRSGNGRNVRLC